jgi:hypothetical protein
MSLKSVQKPARAKLERALFCVPESYINQQGETCLNMKIFRISSSSSVDKHREGKAADSEKKESK